MGQDRPFRIGGNCSGYQSGIGIVTRALLISIPISLCLWGIIFLIWQAIA